MKQNYVIGIAGGSGSGKSTFANRLQDWFMDEVTVVRCDNYYLPRDHMTYEERTKVNYDSPEAFEFSLMVDQINSLKCGKAIECPVYDFVHHTRSKETILLEPKPIILVDGILVFADAALRELCDLKIYVETDADERILRRARRDMAERGRDFDSIISQYLNTVKPMHNLFVEPTKAYADVIINGGKNEIALDMVRTKIQSILQIQEEA